MPCDCSLSGCCVREVGLRRPDIDHFSPAFHFQIDGGWFTWWDFDYIELFTYTGTWEWFPDEWPRAEWRKHRYHRRKA